MTEINISVKEEKKIVFTFFYFLNKSLCSLTFTCLIFFPRIHSVRFKAFLGSKQVFLCFKVSVYSE